MNIPEMLRKLADEVEANSAIDSVTVLIPRHNDYPQIRGFGDMSGFRDPLIACEMAKTFLVVNIVERQ